MPDNKEISQLTTAEQTSNSDLIETSIPNGMTTTGYISRKQSVSMLETQMLGNTQYDTELSAFTQGNRSIFKALIEARGQGGGGGTANLTELTQAEYDALEQAGELEEDMMYFITDANGDGSQFQPVIYSTSEREIGVWKNGKPLYEKTIPFQALPSTSGTFDYPLGLTGYDEIVSYELIISDGTNSITLPFYSSDPSYVISAYLTTISDELNVEGFVGKDRSAFNDNKVIVRYTKTADTAGSGTWTPQGVPSQHYSTTEQVVGTWIDGSTIYEKTFTGLSISAGTSWVDTGISLSDNSMYQLIKCDARDSRQSFPASIGTINNDANVGIYLFVNNRTITTLTIQYTKSSS